MISFFPDLNVWLALSISKHIHTKEAWDWLGQMPYDAKLIFCRYTNLGLLRLLTNQAVMGDNKLSLRTAWKVYDDWLMQPIVEYQPEPVGAEFFLRELTQPFADKSASNVIGDCYLLACARASNATLVTFDRGLKDLARKHSYPALVPGERS